MNRQELQESFEITIGELSSSLEKRASGLPVMFSQPMSLSFGSKNKKSKNKNGMRLTPMGEPNISLMPLLADKGKTKIKGGNPFGGIKIKPLKDISPKTFDIRNPVTTAGVRGFNMPMPELS